MGAMEHQTLKVCRSVGEFFFVVIVWAPAGIPGYELARGYAHKKELNVPVRQEEKYGNISTLHGFQKIETAENTSAQNGMQGQSGRKAFSKPRDPSPHFGPAFVEQPPSHQVFFTVLQTRQRHAHDDLRIRTNKWHNLPQTIFRPSGCHRRSSLLAS